MEMPKWFEKNIKTQSWKKIIKDSIYNLSSFRMFIKKRTIPKNCTQRKMLSMSLLAGQCLQDVHLIYQKINSIITEEGIVLKNCVKS